MVEVSRFPESRIGYRIFLAHRHIGGVLNIEEAAEIWLALGSARNGLRLRLGGGGLGQSSHRHQSQRGPESGNDIAERKTVLHGPPVRFFILIRKGSPRKPSGAAFSSRFRTVVMTHWSDENRCHHTEHQARTWPPWND